MQPLPFALAIVNDLWDDELDGVPEPVVEGARRLGQGSPAGPDAAPPPEEERHANRPLPGRARRLN